MLCPVPQLPETTTSKIDTVICVCSIKDLATWLHASPRIIKHIPAANYRVIVPGRYVALFEALSPSQFEIVDENKLTTDFDLQYVKARMPVDKHPRAGWYYQQLLKIQALITFAHADSEVVLIWDADTIPLQDLSFIQDDKLIYFKGSEAHPPYFAAIARLLGYSKIVDFSFIAQSFPVYREWVTAFIDLIETKHGQRWFDAILGCTAFDDLSGFSEYETLGTFIAHHYPQRVLVNNARWERFGDRVGAIDELDRITSSNPDLAFVSFESWEARTGKQGYKATFSRPKSDAEFLRGFFSHQIARLVIQVGANDGQMEDPLYPYLSSKECEDVAAILIEPLDYYFGKLSSLYASRPNTVLIKAAMSSEATTKTMYYLDPNIATEMNGDGPKNNWAHGQGSFSKDMIVHWIKANAFRGPSYVRNIPRYIASILDTPVSCFPLRNIHSNRTALTLLVIDAQGAEREVLLGVNWCAPPDIILFEQDAGIDEVLGELLTTMHFDFVCGTSNVLYINSNTVKLS